MLPVFAQELPTSCVAACVRMVLGGLRQQLTEADIRKRCGHTALGMQLNRIADGLKDIPVSVEYRIECETEELTQYVENHAWPIVGIDLRFVEGIFAFHAVVVTNITSDQVVVHDPMYETGPRSLGRLSFDAAWNAADREAVIITAGLAQP